MVEFAQGFRKGKLTVFLFHQVALFKLIIQRIVWGDRGLSHDKIVNFHNFIKESTSGASGLVNPWGSWESGVLRSLSPSFACPSLPSGCF